MSKENEQTDIINKLSFHGHKFSYIPTNNGIIVTFEYITTYIHSKYLYSKNEICTRCYSLVERWLALHYINDLVDENNKSVIGSKNLDKTK